MRARAGRGNRAGSDKRLRRACSFVEDSAVRGCGDGRVSSGVFFLEDRGVGDDNDVSCDSASNSARPSWAAAVLWNRDCIR